uniref:Uncharacterized protein n=1 Tax=Gasterosteus aculeatus TaxID=69293 RepID=G3PRR7_GASAC
MLLPEDMALNTVGMYCYLRAVLLKTLGLQQWLCEDPLMTQEQDNSRFYSNFHLHNKSSRVFPIPLFQAVHMHKITLLSRCTATLRCLHCLH